MNLIEKNWVKIAVFNLSIVVCLGVLMRYKIAFNFPFLEQKNILHSHSHFAFSGWISQTILLYLYYFIKKHTIKSKKYAYILVSNLICSYGMLVFFMLDGYSAISIVFSTLSIVITALFTYFFSKDTRKIKDKTNAIIWFRAALFFNLISAFGTFYLAYMMASKHIIQDFYLASIYYYLHFQYNGWFFFSIIGLFIERVQVKPNQIKLLNGIFWGLFISTLVTYFLSILWANLPSWLYALTILFTVLQTYLWFKLQSLFKNNIVTKGFSRLLKVLLFCVLVATNLKFLMQLGLVIPKLNTLVFGTRTIVIAYLHLVLLGIITLFLLYHMIVTDQIKQTKNTTYGLYIFIIGIILNEILLFSQGGLSFFYILIPWINEILFCVGILLLFGIFTILQGVIKQKK